MKKLPSIYPLILFLLALLWPLSNYSGFRLLLFKSYDLIVLPAFIILIVLRLRGKKFNELKSHYDLPVILFISVCISSGILSPDPVASFHTIKDFTLYFLIFYIFLHTNRDSRRYITFGLFLSLLALSFSGVALYVYKAALKDAGFVRAEAWFPSPNLLGASLVMTLPGVLLFQCKDKLSVVCKNLLLFIMGFALILTCSRSNLIAIVGVSFIYCILVKRCYRWVMALLIIYVSFFMILLLLPSGEFLERLINFASFRWDLYALIRIDVWKSSVSMWLSSPLIGIGPHGYQYLYPEYALPGAGRYYLYLPHAHNIFLHILAETGLIGFLSFLWMIVLILRDSFRNARIEGRALQEDISSGLFLGLIAYLFHSLFDYTLWFNPVGFLFFMCAGLACSKTTGTAPAEQGD